MNRSFQTHEIRKVMDLGGLWKFETPHQAQQMFVPSCWENVPGLEGYRGTAEYSREIIVEDSGPLRLVFEGVSHTAQVYVDDVLLMRHYGAYGAFSGICFPGVGSHQLRVAVDNSFSEDSALHVPNDYMTYGGITRPCQMETVSNVYIQSVRIGAKKDSLGWHLALAAVVENLSDTDVLVTLRFSAGAKEIEIASPMKARQTQLVSGQIEGFQGALWEPEAPNLYCLKTVLLVQGVPVDDLIERFGLREISWDSKGLLLNGRRTFIKGFNRHEDLANYGCAIPIEAMMHDLMLIKDMGANAIRTSHYPNDQRFLDLCDEMGILVWEEGHARGLHIQQQSNPHFMAQCRLTLTEMITQHHHHPSIIIWGMLNECASETQEGRRQYQELFSLMRSLDASRPVVSASCRRGADWHIPGDIRPEAKGDICHDLEDIVCHNIYPGWYTDTSTYAMIDALWDAVQPRGGAGKPLIISEIGAGALYGYHDPGHAKWSEERQSDILAEQLDALLTHPHVAGFFLWHFCDCRITGEGNGFRDRPRTMNNKGAVDEYRRPKIAYNTIREKLKENTAFVWSKRPEKGSDDPYGV